MTLNEQFQKFLADSPAMLLKFVDILNEFYKLQGSVIEPQLATIPEGPQHIRLDQPPVMLTKPITNAELDAFLKERADAKVKELALEWAKGFIAGLTVLGMGGAA